MSTPILRFKARYIEPILAGRKTQTLRTQLSPNIIPGVIVNAACHYDRPPFAELRIRDIRSVRVGDIDDACARADGFSDAQSLRLALSETYPTASVLFAIRFKVL